MPLLDAVRAIGVIPLDTASQTAKKRYSELLSKALAFEVAAGLRDTGFRNVKPLRGQPGEKEFQGGLGPKRVDVSYADERHGLLLAVSIKTICVRPYGKNLKNRFGDLCTEAITLHMRFPYSVVCALFAMPEDADQDTTPQRRISTFQQAGMLMGTISGRADYAAAGEKFEDVTMMLFRPLRQEGGEPWVRLYSATGRQPFATAMQELSEHEYFQRLQAIYNLRNPHAQVGIEDLGIDGADAS
ncbi:MAG: hypothetical protein HY331_15820 [Chloroflexi bacterium]|nr:hypothetical protein [Chloroflexota bacterium]